tara:strand:- start:173 stop:361 length:189 start_codon:yes stop_codon:yes gene_type:complete
MSLEKLYKKVQTNLMNARIERTLIINKQKWDSDTQTDDELFNQAETETLERILDWEEFSEVR